MAQVFENDSARERARIDGRIAFVAAAFALAFGFAALLDRVGAPLRLVETVAPCFTVFALGLLGFQLHSMRVSAYYAAGRAMPTEYAGFALGSLVAGIVCLFAPQFAGRGWIPGLAGGVFAGVAVAGAAIGPLLRKSGAFSLSGLFAQRFVAMTPRLIVLGLSSLCAALIALAGQQAAADALTAVFGGGRIAAALAVSLAALLIAAPGGLLGTLWTICAAGAVAILGLGWPVLALALKGAAPFGAGGSVWGEVATGLESFGALTPRDDPAAGLIDMIAAMLGVATLAPLLAPAVASHDPGDARRVGLIGFGWTLLFAWLVAATVAGTALSLAYQTLGRPPERLADAVYDVSARRELTLCGALAPNPVAGHAACPSGALKNGDVAVLGDALLTGLPTLEGMGAAAAGLASAARIALALALAAAGLQAFGTTLGHEALFRLRGATDLTSRRLATTRIALTGLATLGFILSGFIVSDAAALMGLALCFSAGLITPLAGLSLWPRFADRDALAALAAGCLGITAVFAMAGTARQVDALAAAALFGAVCMVAGGALSALSRGPERTAPGAAFLRRLLHGDGEVAPRDKGA